MNNKYIPGVCNIGKKEMDFRKNSGIAGLVFTAFFLIVIIVFRFTPIVKILAFLPIFLTTISLMQYKMHFCAELGILGKYNFTDRLGHALSVEQKESLRLDRIKALKIIIYSSAISLAATILVVMFL